MIRLPRRLLMWGGAAVVGAAGFAYMASGPTTPAYSSANTMTVTGYAVYDASIVPDGTTGNIGYIDFETTPTDDSHLSASIPAYAEVEVAGVWYDCTRLTDTDSYTDVVSTSGIVTDNGSPQDTWTCDVRSGGIDATTWAGVDSLEFLVTGSSGGGPGPVDSA